MLTLGTFRYIYLVEWPWALEPELLVWPGVSHITISRGSIDSSYPVTVLWSQDFPPQCESMPRANCETHFVFTYHPAPFGAVLFRPLPLILPGVLALCLPPGSCAEVRANTASGLTPFPFPRTRVQSPLGLSGNNAFLRILKKKKWL